MRQEKSFCWNIIKETAVGAKLISLIPPMQSVLYLHTYINVSINFIKYSSTFPTLRVIRTETNLKHSEWARNFFSIGVRNLAWEGEGGMKGKRQLEWSIGSRLCVLFVVWFVAVANETYF